MKKNYSNLIEKPSENKPDINEEALNFKIEDLSLEKKYYFNVDNEKLSVFKTLDEPYLHAFLKVMAYYLCKPSYPNIKIDPPIYKKYKADLMSLNYELNPVCWAEVLERDYEKIEYIVKHFHVEYLILFEMSEDISNYLNEIRKKVHYKYHHLIKVINFDPVLIHYIDPTEVVIVPDWYHSSSLQE